MKISAIRSDKAKRQRVRGEVSPTRRVLSVIGATQETAKDLPRGQPLFLHI